MSAAVFDLLGKLADGTQEQLRAIADRIEAEEKANEKAWECLRAIVFHNHDIDVPGEYDRKLDKARRILAEKQAGKDGDNE